MCRARRTFVLIASTSPTTAPCKSRSTAPTRPSSARNCSPACASGIERNYTGQVARDVVRLLQADANPGELIWEAIAHGAPRAEFGWGHSVASATDCLSMIDLYDGDQRALPIVQGIMGIAESERNRPVNRCPTRLAASAATASAFRAAIEREQTETAQAMVLAAIERGDGPDQLRPWFTSVVTDHHLSYGHGAIYGQKAFELLDMIGWERADTVLPYLVPTLVYGTREDKLPYMRLFMKALGAVDLARLRRCGPSRGGATTVGCATLCSATDGQPRSKRPSRRCARVLPSTTCSTSWCTR